MKNVYNIIEESPFYLDIENYRFYFSSEFNRVRFENKYKEYIKEENNKINHRYNFNVNLSIPLLFSLYSRIEKRGFRVYSLTDEFLLLKEIKFSSNIIV